MLRTTDYCKEFKNGNINIKFDNDAIEEFKKDELLFLCDCFFWIDCDFIGATYCLRPYATGHPLSHSSSDLVYIFPWSCLEDLKQGKTVKLYARKPDEYDRQLIEEE